MKLDQKTVHDIAHLARLDFKEQDEADMLASMSEILDWVEKLRELDTSDVEPLKSMSDEVNNLRKDEVKATLTHEEGLKNAPDKDSDYFRVPKFLD